MDGFKFSVDVKTVLIRGGRNVKRGKAIPVTGHEGL
jgi:hypothetical protein